MDAHRGVTGRSTTRRRTQRRGIFCTHVLISGRGKFPGHLLAKQGLFLATGDDGQRAKALRVSRIIHAVRYSPDGTKANPAPWKAAGWTIVDDTGI